jgi:surfeit locus 1 family protein
VDNWKKTWPVRVQQIDLKRAEKALGGPLYPAVLKVAEPLTAKFITAWQVVNMPPVKHQAYALQWFGLALVLITGISWLVRDWWVSRRRKEVV